MIDAKTLVILTESAFILGEHSPGLAARTLARAAKQQSVGGKVALIRQLAVKLAEDEPGLMGQAAQELNRLAAERTR